MTSVCFQASYNNMPWTPLLNDIYLNSTEMLWISKPSEWVKFQVGLPYNAHDHAHWSHWHHSRFDNAQHQVWRGQDPGRSCEYREGGRQHEERHRTYLLTFCLTKNIVIKTSPNSGLFLVFSQSNFECRSYNKQSVNQKAEKLKCIQKKCIQGWLCCNLVICLLVWINLTLNYWSTQCFVFCLRSRKPLGTTQS